MQTGFEKLRSTQLYRPGTSNPDFSFSTGQWADSIDRLLAAQYSFLPCRFSDTGYLFRGMRSGVRESIAGRCFGHFSGDDELFLAEQIMDIYFLTHEISDAVTVSGLFKNPGDGAILAIQAKVFNDYLDEYKAAVLGIGDGGIVFRFPFITTPLAASQIDYLFVAPDFANEIENFSSLTGKIIPVADSTRKTLETNLAQQCRRLGITPAYPARSSVYPRRS